MGLIGKVLQSAIKNGLREIQMEMYPNFVKSPRQILPPGIDAVPIADDQGVMIMIDGSQGKAVQIGIYPDPQAESGEVRFYSRDDNGNQQAFLWLKKDGTIEINGSAESAVAFAALKSGFDTLKSDHNSHMHTETGAVTTPPIIPSVASVDASEIPGVKLP